MNIFVFGSNRQGRHGKGAALAARVNHGAVNGSARGLQGRSYAIVTKELRSLRTPVSLYEIEIEVAEFLLFAANNPQHRFNVTRIGCGLAGFTPAQIAPLFAGHPANVILPDDFRSILNSGD